MLDELDTIGGTLKIEGLGDFNVTWQDEVLSLTSVNMQQLQAIVSYLRNGPKAHELIQKLAEKSREVRMKPTVADPPAPVEGLRTPVLTPKNATARKHIAADRERQIEALTVENVGDPEVVVVNGAGELVAQHKEAAGVQVQRVLNTHTGRFDASKPNLSNVPKAAEPAMPTIGLDPRKVQEEYDRQEAAKKKVAEENAKAAAKAKAAEEKAAAKKAKAAAPKPKPAAPMATSDDLFAFALPEGVQDVPEIPEEQKAQLSAKLAEVNAAAEALAASEDGWQIPLVGEQYDGEGVDTVTMKDKTVVMKLASGTIVECDIEDGTELQRAEPDTPGAEAAEAALEGEALPQELATTPKVSDLVLHFSQRGMGKDAIVAALTELKQAAHPAVANVENIEARVGMML